MIDKDILIKDLRYSSQWNEPCPEWVYRKIEAMGDAEPCEDAIDRYAALAILNPLSVEYKEMKALPLIQPKRPTAEPEVRTQMSSADCISRQEVNRLIDEILENDNLQAPSAVWYCLHRLKGLPSAQPEIIRCKDCVWRDGSICRNNDTMPWSDDDFCSFAERRE